MPENRFFIPEPLINELEMPKEELHHLLVMRKKIGDPIEIVNGRGELAIGTIVNLGRNGAKVRIDQVKTPPETETHPLILAQALPRFNRLEIIIEKGVELGISAFWLFPAARSEKKSLSAQQKRRLEQISIAALKQCGRLDLPPILEKPTLKQWSEGRATKFFGDLNPAAPPFWHCLQNISLQNEGALFFIGPESGFTEEEEHYLKSGLGAMGVKLHANILRVDTAAIVAISYLSLIC